MIILLREHEAAVMGKTDEGEKTLWHQNCVEHIALPSEYIPTSYVKAAYIINILCNGW
jgi:hypothetical protein